MATTIIRTLSGIRGLIDGPMTPFETYKTVRAYFDVYLKRHILKTPEARHRIVIGRDPKISGLTLIPGALAALKDINKEFGLKLAPYFMGLSTSPQLEWAVLNLPAAGGINFTASHNPIEWNGIKLIARAEEHATLLDGTQMARIIKQLAVLDKKFTGEIHEGIIARIAKTKIPKTHTAIITRFNRDVVKQVKKVIDDCAGKKGLGTTLFKKIISSEMRVAVDGCSGDGGAVVVDFLRHIGIAPQHIILINTGPIEKSIRRLEPAPPYLTELRKTVQNEGAIIGFAVDPDQDRLVAMPLSSEEHSPLLAARFLFELQHKAHRLSIKKACVNLSTTGAWEEVAETFGAEIVRTEIGELNVARGMIRTNSILGAEGNGGVLLAPVNYCRNSTVAISLMLCYLAYRETTLAQLEDELPRYVLVKDKMETPHPKKALDAVAAAYKNDPQVASIDARDGYKIVFNDRSWLQVRASNTEPIVRVFAETRVDHTITGAQQHAARLIADASAIIAQTT